MTSQLPRCFFSTASSKKNHRKWGSCDVIKVLLISWWLYLLFTFLTYEGRTPAVSSWGWKQVFIDYNQSWLFIMYLTAIKETCHDQRFFLIELTTWIHEITKSKISNFLESPFLFEFCRKHRKHNYKCASKNCFTFV